MHKLDRYIGTTVFFAILAVLGIITALALLFAFIDELNDLAGAYGTVEALRYVALTAPRRMYEMLPMASMIGCLIGLGALASHSELTVMRAAGVSVGRIVWAVMKPMLVLMLAGLLVGEYVAPHTESLAQGTRSLAQGLGEAQTSKRGVWHREGQEYIHINAVQPNGKLFGITRYRFDAQRNLEASSFAKRAIHQPDGYWLLEEVRETRFLGESTELITRDQERWQVELTPELLTTVSAQPDALSITGLWSYIGYLDEQDLNNGGYKLAFWTKVLQPLVTAALVMLAISFVFGPLRSVTLGQRVFTGVVVGFVFRIAQDLLGPSSLVFGFPPLLAVLLPALLCALLGVLLMRRAG
ncbi:LPS export ABC transporter permease LptG [Atopomonas sediminilitoris]|uniref:LPS export ABC transporter permease LptG n=1 Tax=Atopomonas sediminilitoris TaxID=2919919 RepID=UPI001F4DAEBC|nr:LPS export ABC transporter permease LptG [Atopomonas sediminilitoris]MCJ8168732.1 LPS export ABC transporter permease LptG [Atopomonas sediminilitoris]